jgi:hypothetical protein
MGPNSLDLHVNIAILYIFYILCIIAKNPAQILDVSHVNMGQYMVDKIVCNSEHF